MACSRAPDASEEWHARRAGGFATRRPECALTAQHVTSNDPLVTARVPVADAELACAANEKGRRGNGAGAGRSPSAAATGALCHA
jgi:hypothetical protein